VNIRLIIKLLAALNLVLGCTMIIPLVMAFVLKQPDIKAFAVSLTITVVLSTAAYLSTRKVRGELNHRHGFLVVSLGWLSVCFFGALPFYFGGQFGDFTNCYFESVSGFTTTGSTILTKISTLPKATLFWRSIIQWYGGMGIIVLSLAILPLLGVGGMQLFKAEVPGPVTDKIQPRVRDTAKLLWRVYVIITAAQVLFLWLGGTSLFDSICHSFTTMATGGFSTKDDSVMSSFGLYNEMIITFFMFLGGVNFALHYMALKGDIKAYFRDGEFKVYTGIVVTATLLLAVVLYLVHIYDSPFTALRYSVFQVVSIMTTTGYNSADYELWTVAAPIAPVLFILLMFIGGTTGSTGGGMKVIRVWLAIKHGYRELFLLIHPRAVRMVKIGGKVVPEAILDSVIGFVVLYILIFIFATIIMSLLGYDFMTSVTSVATTLSNVGPGLGEVGPTDNFNGIALAGKWLLIACMLIGRLEIYTLILLLVPEFWRR